MKIFEFISEITKPVGTIYLRFKVRQGEKDNYLTAIAGFANSPQELTTANARLKFMKLNSMNDLVDMVEKIMQDKVFISVKKMTIYADLPEGFMYNAYEEFPFVKEFLVWADRHGGNTIKVEWKPEGEPGDKRSKKPNPLKDIDVDKKVDQPDPNFDVFFTVSDNFYNTLRQMPGVMQFKRGGKTFVMPKDTFDKFQSMADKKFGNPGIHVIKTAHVSESNIELDERGAASRSLCLSKKTNSQLGASQLASCKSQGLRAREGDKSHKFKDGKRVKVGGHKIKGAAHGGPLPDWGTRGSKKKK